MPTSTPVSPTAFRDELVAAGLFLPSGVPGVFGRSHRFEAITDGLVRALRAISASDRAERVAFPPVLPRDVLRRTGYMNHFPQLCGSLHSFTGDERQHQALAEQVEAGADWGAHLSQTAVTMCPAVCYPLYPTLSGSALEAPRTFELIGYVFRHEPSDDPARLQIFRQFEQVHVGTPASVAAWRKTWLQRGAEFLADLALPVHVDVANDLFFGRAGRMMKTSQLEQALKHELLVPVTSDERPTACASVNCHQDHYAHVFNIHDASGAEAHSACVGFGLERVAMALLRWHGMDPARWPIAVRGRLAL